jgi:DnaJ-class molecular chaperone
VARLALRSGDRGEDLRHDLAVTAEEARQGAKKPFRFTRGTEVEEVVVTVPPGVKSGTQLRLKGKGLVGKTGAPGDLYLRIQVPD